MKESDLAELEIEQEGLKLRIRRDRSGQFSSFVGGGQHSLPMGSSPEQLAPPSPQLEGQPNRDEVGIHYIRSPMVGTFYRSGSPESPPYIEPSQKVSEKTTVCIIEAMKVMNEIQADVRGTILEVLMENGQPVEYGQPLYKVKKD